MKENLSSCGGGEEGEGGGEGGRGEGKGYQPVTFPACKRRMN